MKRRGFIGMFLGGFAALFGIKARAVKPQIKPGVGGIQFSEFTGELPPVPEEFPIPLRKAPWNDLLTGGHVFTDPNAMGYGFCLRCGIERTTFIADPRQCGAAPLEFSKEAHERMAVICDQMVKRRRAERSRDEWLTIQAIAEQP